MLMKTQTQESLFYPQLAEILKTRMTKVMIVLTMTTTTEMMGVMMHFKT
jgi:hypothetical protein